MKMNEKFQKNDKGMKNEEWKRIRKYRRKIK